MVCQKLCQNSVSGWGSFEQSIFLWLKDLLKTLQSPDYVEVFCNFKTAFLRYTKAKIPGKIGCAWSGISVICAAKGRHCKRISASWDRPSSRKWPDIFKFLRFRMIHLIHRFFLVLFAIHVDAFHFFSGVPNFQTPDFNFPMLQLPREGAFQADYGLWKTRCFVVKS